MRKIKISNNGRMHLYFIGDVHLPRGKRKLFQKTIDMIKNDEYAKVIIMGDNVESIAANDPRYDHEEMAQLIQKYGSAVNAIDIQWDLFEEDITPIKDKILGIHAGNHEYQFTRRHAINPLASMCRRLGIEYFDNGFYYTEVVGKKGSCNILTHHGHGAGMSEGYVYTRIAKNLKILGVNPDIIACGHTHRLGVNVVTSLAFNGKKITHKNQVHCATGAFLGNYEDKAGYAERAGFPPLPLGFIMAVVEDGVLKRAYPVFL